MNYQINVAKDGKHFFATAEHSILNESKLHEVYDELVKAFPKKNGYDIIVTRWEKIGYGVNMDAGKAPTLEDFIP
jgi:hypothetical protein